MGRRLDERGFLSEGEGVEVMELTGEVVVGVELELEVCYCAADACYHHAERLVSLLALFTEGEEQELTELQ